MEVKVLFPPNKEVADMQATICAVAMRSTRTKEPAHYLQDSTQWLSSCIWRKEVREKYDACIKSPKSTPIHNEKCIYYDRCVERLLRSAKKMKHWGVFEHAYFTVSVAGVSRALTHQLVRHRQDSFLQQSQRAVEIDVSKGDWFVKPHTVDNLSEALLGHFAGTYEEFMRLIGRVYQNLIRAGVPEEDARYVLPNSCKTNIVITANARQWLHIFKLRLDKHAQWEIREMAQKILEEFMKLSPVIFEGAGELDV